MKDPTCLASSFTLAFVPFATGCSRQPNAEPDDAKIFHANDLVFEVDDQFLESTRNRAEDGNADAEFLLGRLYTDGNGVPQDDLTAVRWYRLAADQGHAGAQSSLGVCYDIGEGVQEDDDLVVKWYRLAAARGDAEAHFNLGACYALGEGVPQNEVVAYAWFYLAANLGSSNAKQIVGEMSES